MCATRLSFTNAMQVYHLVYEAFCSYFFFLYSVSFAIFFPVVCLSLLIYFVLQEMRANDVPHLVIEIVVVVV